MKKICFHLFTFICILNVSGQYQVTPIPFKAYVANNANILNTLDDTHSNPLNLPFDFNFFDINYNTYRISTNGYMIFNATNNFSPWSFNLTIPNASFPVKNAILGCYHDMDNGNGQGQITYSTIGAAPFRKHIIIFIGISV